MSHHRTEARIPVSLVAGDVWPEMWQSRPSLVFPGAGRSRLIEGCDAWWLGAADVVAVPETGPRWQVSIVDEQLTVTRPDGVSWFRGRLLAARDWRRALRVHRTLLLVTGGFGHPAELPAAARSGQLLWAAADARVTTGLDGF